MYRKLVRDYCIIGKGYTAVCKILSDLNFYALVTHQSIRSDAKLIQTEPRNFMREI